MSTTSDSINNTASSHASSSSSQAPSSSSSSWADALPQAQGLYNPDLEKDSCGVGFIVSINGTRDHKTVADARGILCNMTHRGAVGADIRYYTHLIDLSFFLFNYIPSPSPSSSP